MMASTNHSTKEPREIKIKVPFGHLAGKVWNENADIAVVCLHGWQDNAGTFDFLAPLLPQHLCLVAVDFPGHGLSSHKPMGFSSSGIDYLITLDRIIKHFGWKKVILLGHSMGGGIAMMYAGTRPNLVHSIIMLDIIKLKIVKPSDLPENVETGLDILADVEKKIMSENRPQYTYEDLLSRTMKSHLGSLDERSARTLLSRGSTELPNGMYTYTYDLQIRTPSVVVLSFEQFQAFAKRLKCRLMLLVADKGLFSEKRQSFDDMIETYRSSCPEFIYKTVPGTHHVHLMTPEVIAPYVSEFLSLENLKGCKNNITETGENVVSLVDTLQETKI